MTSDFMMILLRFRAILAVVITLALCACPVQRPPSQRVRQQGPYSIRPARHCRGFASRFTASQSVVRTRVRTGTSSFPDLPEGRYEISAELIGFERARRAVTVEAGERVTASFTLRLAAVDETIVTAAKSGERDIQAIPMAISAISNAELTGSAHRRWAKRQRSHPQSRFLKTQVSVNSRSAASAQPCCMRGRIRVRRYTSTVSTWHDRRWRSCNSSIWIASRSFADRRAPYMDATLSVGR